MDELWVILRGRSQTQKNHIQFDSIYILEGSEKTDR